MGERTVPCAARSMNAVVASGCEKNTMCEAPDRFDYAMCARGHELLRSRRKYSYPPRKTGRSS
jgi:hypothetical protein